MELWQLDVVGGVLLADGTEGGRPASNSVRVAITPFSCRGLTTVAAVDGTGQAGGVSETPASSLLLTVEELATAAGCPPEILRGWHDLGLLVGDGQRFPLEDLERIRLILYAERRGITADDVAVACRTQGDLLGQFVELITGGAPRVGHPIEDVAARSGLDVDAVRHLWVASGLGDQDEAYDEDLEAQQWLAFALAAGIPEDALVQLIRVYADALGRVAEAEGRLFHYYVHERLRAEGLHGDELTAATNAVSEPVLGLVEPALLYFHRKGFQRASRDDFILHLTEATTPPGQTIGEMTATIMFVDLAGFTPLTESMGDDAAARVVERFSNLARDAAARHRGRIVKQIGDEFMLAFADPTDAVSCGLDIDVTVSAEKNFPAVSIGAHHGTLLYREGDYIGTTVNIAARVTSAANHQFLITDALRDNARIGDDAEVVHRGQHALKGISGEVDLYEVSRRAPRPDRVFDPVCHMALDPETVPVTIHSQGREVPFCSTACAGKFEADPGQYEDSVSS
jgi:class 3 adenylate cyclase/YHS domain-containing protein/DNA-binding transcriptional MerR regulator